MALTSQRDDPRLEAATQSIAAQRQLNSAGAAVNALRSNVEAMKVGMLSAFLTIVTGGSKLQAVFDGIKYGLIQKVLGPLGMVVGISGAVLSAIKGMARGFAQLGMGGAGSIERLQNEFRILLRGMEAARQKVAEIRKFSDDTPFTFGDVSAGTKALESLTRGALSTKEGMTLVGDEAAVTGTQFQEMAVLIGRAYDGLASGRPIGEVLSRLQELGGISGATRNAIEGMQQSGAGFSETWRVLESDLKRSQGAMAVTAKTLEGMRSTLEDTQDTMAAGFAGGFLEGEKTAVQGMTDALSRLTPVTDYFGQLLGTIVGVEDKAKAKLLDMATALPGVQTGMKAAGTAIIAFNAAVVALAGARVGKFSIGMMLKGATGSVGAAKAEFAVAGKAIGQAFQFAMAGQVGNAFGAIRNGSTAALSALRAGGMSAVVAGIGRIFSLLGTIVRSTFTMMGGWPMAAVALLATAGYMIYDNWSRAAKALKSYNAATDETIARLQSQASAIQTADDLSRTYAATLAELGQAHRDAGAAAQDGNEAMEAAARARITRLRIERAELDKVARAALRKSDAYYERQTSQHDDARQVAEVRRTGQQDLMGDDAKLNDLKAQRDEILKLSEASKRMLDGIETVHNAQREAADGARAAAGDYSVLEEEMIRLEKAARDASPSMKGVSAGTGGATMIMDPGDPAALKAAEAGIERLREKMIGLDAASQEAGRSLRIAVAADNEIAVLEAKLNLYNQYGAVLDSVAKARQSFNEAGDDRGKQGDAQKRLQQLEITQRGLERAASANGVTLGPGGAGAAGAMQAQIAEFKALASEKEKTVRLAEQDRQIAQQQLEVLRRRRELELDLAQQVASAQDNAYQAELDRFDLAKQRRAMERDEAEARAREIERTGKGTPASKAAAAATRDQARREQESGNAGDAAAKAAFQRDALRQLEQAKTGVAASQMNVAATTQRKQGNISGAQSLEESAARAQDEAERASMERSHRDHGASPAEAKALTESEITTRGQQRQQGRDEENKQVGFARSASAGSQAAESLRLTALQAEAQGHLDYADALREAAEKTERAATFQQRVADVVKNEGKSKEEATAQVKKADATAAKQREQEQAQTKKKRDLAKKGVESENKARHAEMGGNDERASRIREEQSRKEREQALKEQGFSAKDAAKQAKKEMHDSRRKRRQDGGGGGGGGEGPKAADFIAKKTHSLQRVGGGGGAYGPGSHIASITGRMDQMLRHLASIASARSGSQPGGQATRGGLDGGMKVKQ